MESTRLDAPVAIAERDHDMRRVSHEPLHGYVLDPWSGLYRENETAYRHRINAEDVALV